MRVAGFAQQLQAFQAHALKGVGRAARLEGAAAQDLGSGLGDLLGGSEDLLARFDGAGSGHDHDFLAADFDSVGELDDGVVGRGNCRPTSL